MSPTKKRSRKSNGSHRINEGASTSNEVVSPFEALALENTGFAKETPKIYVECTKCKKWRLPLEYFEVREVPDDWECRMWIKEDGQRGSCDMPGSTECPGDNEKFPEGTIVWAKLGKYAEWPGMVESDPNLKLSYRRTKHGRKQYNVTFFGLKPSHQWVLANKMRLYEIANPEEVRNKGLKLAVEQGNEAFVTHYPVRITKYSLATLRPELWRKTKIHNGPVGNNSFKESEDGDKRPSTDGPEISPEISFDSHASLEQPERMHQEVPSSTNGRTAPFEEPQEEENVLKEKNEDTEMGDLSEEALAYKAFLDKSYPPIC